MKLKTFSPGDVQEKKVLIRVDFNVPFKDGRVRDDNRIRAHTPTVAALADAGAKVAMVSHFGRPKGKVVPEMSLGQIRADVEKAYGRKTRFVDDCIGPKVTDAMNALAPGELLLLENVRFYAEEQRNDLEFAKKLAAPFDVFVMDAFSASHRADASTSAVMTLLPSFAGALLQREAEMLGAVSRTPRKPYVLILGGAKVSDKIAVVENLMTKANTILIGGGMAYTFLKVRGHEIGKSLCDTERLDFARKMIEDAKKLGVNLLLPVDHVVAASLEATETQTVDNDHIPADMMGLDIGPKTAELFASALDGAQTVLWNGPMGVFENHLFAQGTIRVGEAVGAVTAAGGTTVVGGGDTASAVKNFKLAEKMSHVSTGGGASLEFC
jgi:phosphoglycerate kinase